MVLKQPDSINLKLDAMRWVDAIMIEGPCNDGAMPWYGGTTL